MDDFQKKFLDEATDLINNLEEALLDIESNPNDKKLIERIFRVMHSLKGGGAMFGFEKISEFTHNLENIYDLIRNDKLKLNPDILNVTLDSVDHLKLLLEKDKLDPGTLLQHGELSLRIAKLINDGNLPKSIFNDNLELESRQVLEKQLKTTYYIQFIPNENILQDGSNPLYLLDELTTIGDYQIFPSISNIPDINDFNENICYTYWDIFISISEDIQILKDVFLFVEDSSKVNITEISKGNLLLNKRFIIWIDEIYQKGQTFDLEKIQSFLASELKIEIDKEKVVSKSKKFDTKENLITSIRVSSEKVDSLMNLVSELVTTQASLSLYAENSKLHDLIVISENVENLTRQLRDIAFSISLIPVETMLTRFQRLVRDLSAEFKKDIQFEISGADTELDKTLIQNLTEPLMHIIRNSVDHGIESKEERKLKGKNPQGRITFKAYYSGAHVIIKLEDDGKGIDPFLIRQKAIDKGIIHSDANFPVKDYLNMVFLPGLSTAQVITEFSGRGVGMDIVMKKINEVRGEVELESEIDKGTTVTIKLPLTLSIIDGLLVKINKTHYVIPLSVVDKIFEANHNQLTGTFNNIIILDEEQIPFYYLREEFGEMEDIPMQEQIVVVTYEDVKVGLAVDYVVGEYQAVLKPLGRHYKNHEIISGATILGDGTIALVLDTNKIIKQFSTNDLIG